MRIDATLVHHMIQPMDEFEDFDEDMIFTSVHLHIIFSTSHQMPLISDELREEMWEVIRETLREKEATVECVGGTADHVHVLIAQPLNVSVDELIQAMKKNSAAWVHETFPEKKDFAWQEGYAGFAIEAGEVPKATAYIDGQAEHHKIISFQDEYRALLMENGIEFDEKDLFD